MNGYWADKWRIDRSSLALLILCVSGLLLQSCNERMESFYPVLSDAIASGAIYRGWIPDFLPKSAYDIHEMHYTDASIPWCSFNFSPDDSQYFRNALAESIDELPSGLKSVDSPKKSWWPEFLEDDPDIEMIHERGFALYNIEEPSYIDQTRPVLFAIDWAKGLGFFYRPYS